MGQRLRVKGVSRRLRLTSGSWLALRREEAQPRRAGSATWIETATLSERARTQLRG